MMAVGGMVRVSLPRLLQMEWVVHGVAGASNEIASSDHREVILVYLDVNLVHGVANSIHVASILSHVNVNSVHVEAI